MAQTVTDSFDKTFPVERREGSGMDEKMLRQRADYMTADGFFLALTLISRYGVQDNPENYVNMLQALVGEDEQTVQSLMNRLTDAVNAIERRRGRPHTDEEMEDVRSRADDVIDQQRIHQRETARAILRGLQAEGREVGIRFDS